MNAVHLRQCYRCRRLFPASDPRVKYCPDCLREVRRRRYIWGTDTSGLVFYTVGLFSGLFLYYLGHPATRWLGVGLIGYTVFRLWKRYPY